MVSHISHRPIIMTGYHITMVGHGAVRISQLAGTGVHSQSAIHGEIPGIGVLHGIGVGAQAGAGDLRGTGDRAGVGALHGV